MSFIQIIQNKTYTKILCNIYTTTKFKLMNKCMFIIIFYLDILTKYPEKE